MYVIAFHKVTRGWLQDTIVVVTHMALVITEDFRGQTKHAPSSMAAQSQGSVPGECQACQEKVSRVGKYFINSMPGFLFC